MITAHPAALCRSIPVVLLALCSVSQRAFAADLPGAEQHSRWNASTTVSLRAALDSNVYLQDMAPSAAVPDAVPARRASLVTSASVSLGLQHRHSTTTGLSVNYTPERVQYYSTRGESYSTHRFAVDSQGSNGDSSWKFLNTATRISGSEDGPVFGGPGGATALGGIPLRDRRDGSVVRSTLGVRRAFGSWSVAPVATAYVHDFATRQSREHCYVNYIDRREFVTGIDVARTIAENAKLLAGFRAGRQQQRKLHGIDSPFDSALRRFLAGFEGKPWNRVQVSLLGGPETRSFATGTPAGFDRGRIFWWMDGTVHIAATAHDACTITARRFAQPAFTSLSVYEDITYEANWRHRFSAAASATAGAKVYRGKWVAPAVRDDWIISPVLSLTWSPNPRTAGELSCSVDRAESRVPDTAGREFKRRIAAATLRFSF